MYFLVLKISKSVNSSQSHLINKAANTAGHITVLCTILAT